MATTLYRVCSAHGTGVGTAWAETLAAAEHYLHNGGNSGPIVRAVVDSDHVLDLRDRARCWDRLVSELLDSSYADALVARYGDDLAGLRAHGYLYQAWESDRDVFAALAEGYSWVRYEEDAPACTYTWARLDADAELAVEAL